jgi:hypothetical protein
MRLSGTKPRSGIERGEKIPYYKVQARSSDALTGCRLMPINGLRQGYSENAVLHRCVLLAGGLGFEPRLAESESATNLGFLRLEGGLWPPCRNLVASRSQVPSPSRKIRSIAASTDKPQPLLKLPRHRPATPKDARTRRT